MSTLFPLWFTESLSQVILSGYYYFEIIFWINGAFSIFNQQAKAPCLVDLSIEALSVLKIKFVYRFFLDFDVIPKKSVFWFYKGFPVTQFVFFAIIGFWRFSAFGNYLSLWKNVSRMKYTKNFYRSNLTDEHFKSQLISPNLYHCSNNGISSNFFLRDWLHHVCMRVRKYVIPNHNLIHFIPTE